MPDLSSLSFGWMHDTEMSEAELRVAELVAGRSSVKDSISRLIEVVREYDALLPLADCGGYEPEMRYLVAARALGLGR
jgi:hypothetical protein